MIFIVICIQNAANSLPLRHNFFSQLWFNFWVDNMGWYISFHRRTGTNQVLITMSIIYSTNAWPQFGVSLNKGLKKKNVIYTYVTIICQFDELRLSLTWIRGILFAEINQTPLKVSCTSILLIFMHLVKSVQSQVKLELNSSLWRKIVAKVYHSLFCCTYVCCLS